MTGEPYGYETAYARGIEGAAMGATVQETVAWIDQTHGIPLDIGCSAVREVAHDLRDLGIEDDDLDPSWLRLRRF